MYTNIDEATVLVLNKRKICIPIKNNLNELFQYLPVLNVGW